LRRLKFVWGKQGMIANLIEAKKKGYTIKKKSEVGWGKKRIGR